MFLNGFVQSALNNGAKPYLPGLKREKGVEYSTIIDLYFEGESLRSRPRLTTRIFR